MIVHSRRQILISALVVPLAIAGSISNTLAATEQQAQAMVAKAVALYDEKGESALAVFNLGASSGFKDGEVYIVVQSRGPDAQVLAHAANPKLVGMQLAKITDPTGLKFAETISNDASEAGSWFEYEWPNPATGKIGKKKSWAVLHKNLVFLAGIYVN